MFLLYLFKSPLYYVSVIVVITLSVWLQKKIQSRLANSGLANPVFFDRQFFLILLMLGVSWIPLPESARNPKTALAAPLTNAVVMISVSLLASLFAASWNPLPELINNPILSLLQLVAFLNGVLFIVNLLPLPPLDGEIIWKARYGAIERLTGWWNTAVASRLGIWGLVLLLAIADPLLRVLAVALMTLPVLLWGYLIP